jgi:choline dehydrogenase
MEGKRATGVEFRHAGETRFVSTRIETVLAAGAIGSPQILQCSGIGPAQLLIRHGIPVIHASPGVGENLQDHLQLRTAFKVKGVRTLNEWAGSPFGKMQMALEYALFRTGPLTMAPSQLGAFTRSDPGQTSANLEYHVQPLSLDKFGDPLHAFPAFTSSVCNLRPVSRGYVRIQSADSREAPVINPRYLSAAEDRAVATQALRLTRRIAAQPALARYSPEEFLPGVQHNTDEELARAAGDVGTTIFHPVGTCGMGVEGDPNAVVDSRLRLIGIEGVRVIDASVMPAITSGNTNSPTIMIAERGAQLLREDRRSRRARTGP